MQIAETVKLCPDEPLKKNKFPNLNSNKWPMSGNVNERHRKKVIIMINNKYFEGAPAYRWGCCWSPVVAGVAKWRPLHFGRKCRPLGGPQAKRGKFDIEVNKTPYFFSPSFAPRLGLRPKKYSYLIENLSKVF